MNIPSCKNYLQSTKVKNAIKPNCSWWSDYIFHFSDINNIVNVLKSGKLYSRNNLNKLNISRHDIASAEVVDGTSDQWKDYVRFYFRPLTPTQYNNEGIFSNSQLKNSSLSAHCPIPVFLLFDTCMLDSENTFFTSESLASHKNINIYNTLEDLSELPFDLIYHQGSFDSESRDKIIKHRHAEILVKDSVDLTHLKEIYCRNKHECLTLLNLLGPEIGNKFKDIIFYPKKELYTTIFEKNRLKIENTNVNIEERKYEFSFNLNPNQNYKLQIIIINPSGIILFDYVNEEFHFNALSWHLKLSDLEKFKKENEFIKIKLLLDDNVVAFNKF